MFGLQWPQFHLSGGGGGGIFVPKNRLRTWPLIFGIFDSGSAPTEIPDQAQKT
jgi:hypothetical protein